MPASLNYHTLDLPEDLPSILEHDFWMLENVNAQMLSSLAEPVKFAATTWIIIFSGSGKADINLVAHDITAPAVVCVKSTQIMVPTYLSPDFNATVIVMSKRFTENLFIFLNNSPVAALMSRHPVVGMPVRCEPDYRAFVANLRAIMADSDNPYGSKAIMYEMLAFMHRTGYKAYLPFKDEILTSQGRITDRFLMLVQEHFRRERFLDFYAEKMDITPKHLSRTVKKQTGYTAVEWIERYVILEAKVLLKSSNLNIQQIADELNFPTQSFFGKYFKKLTGMSPKEFRNA